MLKKILLLILAALVFSCNPDPATENGNEGGASASISGKITLTNSASWDNLKLGFFPQYSDETDPGNSDYLDDEYVDESFDRTDYTSYLSYSNNSDGSNVEITPIASSNESDNSGTEANYTFDLPDVSDIKMSGDDNTFEYSFAIWRDEDADGKLDLFDLSFFQVTSENAGEYSRLPLRSFDGEQASSVHTITYVDSDLGTGYKFSSYNGEVNTIDFFENYSTDFNFTVDE